MLVAGLKHGGWHFLPEALMPTTRKLYTLQEVKELIAKDCNTDVENVDVYEGATLHVEIDYANVMSIEDNNFLFQADVH